MVATLVFLGTALWRQEFTLQRTYRTGEVFIYDVKSEITVQNRQISVKFRSIEKTSEVEPKKVTIELTQTDGVIVVGGQTMAQPERKSVNTIAPSGRLIKITGESIDGDNYRRSGLLTLEFPTKPISIGGEYLVRIRADHAVGSVDAEKRYTVVAKESILGREAVKLKCVAKELGGKKPISMTQDLWVEISTGLLLKEVVVFENYPMINDTTVPGRIEFTLRF